MEDLIFVRQPRRNCQRTLDSNTSGITFNEFMFNYEGTVSVSTMENYKTAVNSIMNFNGRKPVQISILDNEMLSHYYRWLLGRGVCLNTISCYMRSLRSLYNKYSKYGLTNKANPFVDIFTGQERTMKRALKADDINRLRSVKLQKGTRLDLTRDVFLFSFYSFGMPFVDIYNMRKTQINGDLLIFHRKKTGRTIRVKLEKCMLDIIKKWYSKNSDFVFPFNKKRSRSKNENTYYHTCLCYYNKNLKDLARIAGLDFNLTSYVSRHSWASWAYSNNVSIPIISKALGHSNSLTTMTYISDVDDTSLYVANHNLIENLKKRKNRQQAR